MRVFDDGPSAIDALESRGFKDIFASLTDARVAFGDAEDLPGERGDWIEVSERELHLVTDGEES